MKMRKKMLVSMLLLSLMTLAFTMQPVYSGGPNGPRTDNLLIHIYYLWSPAYLDDLETGVLDIADVQLTAEDIERFMDNPSIQMKDYAKLEIFDFDLNNQRWPTGVTLPREYDPCSGTYKHYYGTNQPWDDLAREFRRALAYLTDKDRYIAEVLGGYGYRIDSKVPIPALAGWTDYAHMEEKGLIYYYDPCVAAAILDAAGFVQSVNPNPYYDPTVPCSAQYLRIDPSTGEDLDPLDMYINIDEPCKYQAAYATSFVDELRSAGIPVCVECIHRHGCYGVVMGQYDYHIYTSNFDVGPDIDYLEWLFHSQMYYGGSETSYLDGIGFSPNYIGFCNHEYDYWAEELSYATTLSQAREAALECQQIFAEEVGSIPVWTRTGVKAYKTGWEGVVNMEGYGIDNYWTFLNMYNPTEGQTGTIDYGIGCNLDGLHIITAVSPYDWKVLDLIYDRLIGRNPYNLAEDIGWLAESWETGEWAPGKMYARFTLREGITWHDGTPVTPQDVKFSLMFTRDCGPGVARNYAKAKDIVDVDTEADDPTLGPRDVIVRFSCASYWMLHWAGELPIINMDLWLAANDTYGWGYNWPYAETYLTQAVNAGDTRIYVGSLYEWQPDCTSLGYNTPEGVVWIHPTGRGHDLYGYYLDLAEPFPFDLSAYSMISKAFEWDSMMVRDYHPWNDDANENGIMDLCEDGTGPWVYDSTDRPEAISDSTWVLLTANRQYYLTQTEVSDFLGMAFHAIGDIDYDGDIDIVDMMIIARALGTDDTYPWGTGWDEYNPEADIYTCISWPEWILGDGKVDINDLMTAARNYGKTADC